MVVHLQQGERSSAVLGPHFAMKPIGSVSCLKAVAKVAAEAFAGGTLKYHGVVRPFISRT